MVSVRQLHRLWGDLDAPTISDLEGTFEASFARPLTRVAPSGLGLVGLPRWYGKRFVLDGHSLSGVNLLHPAVDGPLTEKLPMSAAVEPSYADGMPCLAVTYGPGSPRPWRWVRDEVRPWDDDRFVALTFVDRLGLRRLPGTPFVLTRRPDRPAAG